MEPFLGRKSTQKKKQSQFGVGVQEPDSDDEYEYSGMLGGDQLLKNNLSTLQYSVHQTIEHEGTKSGREALRQADSDNKMFVAPIQRGRASPVGSGGSVFMERNGLSVDHRRPFSPPFAQFGGDQGQFSRHGP